MEATERLLALKPKYTELLGSNGALKLVGLFAEIELGKYKKEEVHLVELKGVKHPFYIRSIRADMQSFLNTFIDGYLEKKAYLSEPEYIIDTGANIGYTAILFANWCPNAKIIGIEPDKENYEFALKNTANYPNITILNAGLWNKTTRLKIEAGQEDGFVVKEIAKNEVSINPENLTTAISIKEILETYRFPRIDFLKMNIEGSEKEVFSEGYEIWLPKTKAMLIELHDGKNSGCSKAVFGATSLYDFAVAETAPYGVLFVKEPIYRKWYAQWYKEEIYNPNINKDRFPSFYLDKEQEKIVKEN